MFAELIPHATSLTLTRSNNARASNPTQLAVIASEQSERINLPVEIHSTPDLASAMRHTRAHATNVDVICITGSLFVVAEARELWFAEHGVTIEKD